MCDKLNITDVNPEIVHTIFEEGAIFIFLDVPPGTEFGVDMKVWNTEENFKGVKMIPPGIHFIHYSSVDNCGENSTRSGFFHNFKKNELFIHKWDKDTKDISFVEPTEDEMKRFKDNKKNLDKYLGYYPYDIYTKWISLTNYINVNLVKTLSPTCGIIRAAEDLESCNDADRPRGSAESSGESSSTKSPRLQFRSSSKILIGERTDHLLPELKPVEGTEIKFTKFPERHYPAGATPSEITKHSLDYSYVLQCMLDHHRQTLDFLGEIQFAYVCFLIGGNLNAFERWRELIGLVCSCQEAIIKHRTIYDHFPEMLEIQLAEIPTDFLVDIVSSNNFIYIKLRSLFRSVQESDVDGRLKTKLARFKDMISEKYNWDLKDVDDESDDEAPVVVELDHESHIDNLKGGNKIEAEPIR